MPNYSNAWLTRLVAYPGDDDETLVVKKTWLSVVVFINIFSFVNSFYWYYGLGLKTLFLAELVYVGYFLLLCSLFLYIKRGIDWFVLATALYHIFHGFVVVCLYGGIVNSAGMVFIGFGGGPIYLLLLQKKIKWANPVMALFLLTVVAAIALQPYLKPNPELSADENIILFSGFFLTISVLVFIMLRYSIGENIKIKRAEQERMRELSEMKTRFYTNITHEFRTPLTVILGMSDQIEANPAEHFHNGLSLIRQNGNRLLHLVNQMLDLAKLESGAMPVQYIRGDIMPYLLYIMEPYQRLAEQQGKDVRLAGSPDQLELDFDPEKLESLLGNLLSNAVKYSPRGSTIRVSAGLSEQEIAEAPGWFSLFEQSLPGQKWWFSVADNGNGIPVQELNYIFDRFYQADAGKSVEPSYHTAGTGIGLAVVKELVRLLGGNLLVKSEVGKGTEFRVYLPFSQSAQPAPAASVPLKIQADLEDEPEIRNDQGVQRPDRPQLLIVEDNPGVVLYLKSVLGEDYQLGIAVDGQEGIDMALEAIPDIIISDVMMPRKDGFELCRTLKNDFRTSHIPIILLTAKADTASTITGLEQGADAYISKPFNSAELRTRVRKLIELRKQLQEKYRSMSMQSFGSAAAADPDEAFFQEFHKILERQSTDEDFHAGQLSQSLHLSRTQLFRKLKATTGNSASQIIRSYRLNKARALLSGTKMNISEIAFEVGFKDPAYFTRAFTREFGVKPSALRK